MAAITRASPPRVRLAGACATVDGAAVNRRGATSRATSAADAGPLSVRGRRPASVIGVAWVHGLRTPAMRRKPPGLPEHPALDLMDPAATAAFLDARPASGREQELLDVLCLPAKAAGGVGYAAARSGHDRTHRDQVHSLAGRPELSTSGTVLKTLGGGSRFSP